MIKNMLECRIQISKLLDEHFKESNQKFKLYGGWIAQNKFKLSYWEIINKTSEEISKNTIIKDEILMFEIQWDFNNKDLNKIFSNKHLLPCLDFTEETEFIKDYVREPLLDNYFNLLCLKPEKWMFKKKTGWFKYNPKLFKDYLKKNSKKTLKNFKNIQDMLFGYRLKPTKLFIKEMTKNIGNYEK